jgi:hypothetical protein
MVVGQRHDPAALPPGKTRYPPYRWPSGPQGRSGRVRKISPPTGCDHRTVQPIACRYTDWAILTYPISYNFYLKIYSWSVVWLRNMREITNPLKFQHPHIKREEYWNVLVSINVFHIKPSQNDVQIHYNPLRGIVLCCHQIYRYTCINIYIYIYIYIYDLQQCFASLGTTTPTEP